MPIFEFQCEDCDQEFELLVRHKEEVTCPSCASASLQKLMSSSAGHVASAASSLPITNACPPPEAGPCSPHCCRLP